MNPGGIMSVGAQFSASLLSSVRVGDFLRTAGDRLEEVGGHPHAIFVKALAGCIYFRPGDKLA